MDSDTNKKTYEQLDWNTDEQEIIRRSTEDAKRLGLSSFDELLTTDQDQLKNLLELIQDEAGEPDIGLHVIGIISDKPAHHWLILRSRDDIYEGADAVEVDIYSEKETNKIKRFAEVTNDCWRTIQRDPFILASMYGAIVGFMKYDKGTECVAIFEGDDGWT
jgi:hypothetical protein